MNDQNIKIEYSSDLISHSVHLEAIDTADSKKFRVAKGSNSQPLIFSVGSDASFYVVTKINEEEGWTSHNLSKFLPEKTIITAFDIHEDWQSKQLVIFLATLDGNKKAHLYQTERLSSQDFNWSLSESFWREMKITDDVQNSQINRVYFSGDTVIITTLDKIKDAEIYYINDSGCQIAKLPFNASQIMDVKSGRIKGKKIVDGYFILYKAGDCPQVVFSPAPNQPISGTLLYQLPSDFLPTITSIAVSQSSDPSEGSVLYIAGNTVFECTFYVKDKCRSIIESIQGTSYHDISVSSYNGKKSLYIIQEISDKTRFLTQTDNYTSQEWLFPVPLFPNVAGFAGILNGNANDLQLVDQIIAVDNQNTIQHFTKQIISKEWTFTTILLPSLEKFQEVTSYFASVTIGSDEQSSQILGKKIYITCSVNTTLLINDSSYQFGPDFKVEIVLESSNFYVEYYLTELTEVLLFIESDLWTGRQAVDLSKGFCQSLKLFNSAKAFREALRKDGQPLIPNVNNLDDSFLNNCSRVLINLIGFREKMIVEQTQESSESQEASLLANDSQEVTVEFNKLLSGSGKAGLINFAAVAGPKPGFKPPRGRQPGGKPGVDIISLINTVVWIIQGFPNESDSYSIELKVNNKEATLTFKYNDKQSILQINSTSSAFNTLVFIISVISGNPPWIRIRVPSKTSPPKDEFKNDCAYKAILH